MTVPGGWVVGVSWRLGDGGAGGEVRLRWWHRKPRTAAPGVLLAGRYRLDAVVGAGGQSTVWRASDISTPGRAVAVKQAVARDGVAGRAVRDRWLREGGYARTLGDEPHLVVPYEVVEDLGCLWLVEEYLDCLSLAQLLDVRGALDPPEVAWIGAQIAEALTAVHAAGVVHRDVAPGNVLLARGGDIAKLSDLGVARGPDDDVHRDGAPIGTPLYLSPEEALGDPATAASDVYALGVMLHHAVQGEPPVRADGRAELLNRIRSGYLEPADRAGPLRNLLGFMTAYSPESRPTADDVAEALGELEGTLGDDTRAALRDHHPEPPTPHPDDAADGTDRRRSRVPVALALGAVVLVAVGLWLVLGTGEPSSAAAPGVAGSSPDATYVVYGSTNVDDRALGPPMTVRESTDPPRPEYAVVEVLGTAPAPAADLGIPGTHLVHDFFCTGRGDPGPCGGVLRSHYHSVDSRPPTFWARPASVVGPTARFYDTAADGSCPPGQVAVFRFQPAGGGPQAFRLGTASPGPGWSPAENLGCVRR